MADPEYKVVTGVTDWGSPLSSQPGFETLEEAQAAARDYIAEQKRSGSLAGLGRVMVEETRQDGAVIPHPIA